MLADCPAAASCCRQHPQAYYGAMLLDEMWSTWEKLNPTCSVTGLPLINGTLQRVHLGTCALVVNGYLEGAGMPELAPTHSSGSMRQRCSHAAAVAS